MDHISTRLSSAWHALYYLSIEGRYPLKTTGRAMREILFGDSSRLVDVPTDGGVVRLDATHHPDWRVFRGIFIEETYRTDYAGAVVIDVGAHRGIYAAYALQRSCKAVLAYEPEPANFDLLNENLLLSRRPEQHPYAFQLAVGAGRGSVDFFVYGESWSHSTRRREDKVLVETIRVEKIGFDDVVQKAAELRGNDGRIIAKIDAEGAEFEIIEGTSPESLRQIDEVFLETHGDDADAFDRLDRTLRQAGLLPSRDYFHDAGPHQLHRYSRRA